jgi:hypothetical protein
MAIAGHGTTAGTVPTAVGSRLARVPRRTLMTKVLLATAVALALAAIGSSPPPERSGVVKKYTFLDLQPYGNQRLDDHLGEIEGNDLAELPRGRASLGGTPYKIGERLIVVRSTRWPTPPAAVAAIEVGARFDSLHILHSTMWGNAFGVEDGTEIGTYTVHYADGTAERIPIIYGRDVRDWWRDSDPAATSQGKLAWAGKNQASGAEEGRIRLFATAWKNPHPDRTVSAIDFQTKDTPCAPFLVALTLEQEF